MSTEDSKKLDEVDLTCLSRNMELIGNLYQASTIGFELGMEKGVRHGTARGVLLALECGKKEFGSLYEKKLADTIERRLGRNLGM